MEKDIDLLIASEFDRIIELNSVYDIEKMYISPYHSFFANGTYKSKICDDGYIRSIVRDGLYVAYIDTNNLKTIVYYRNGLEEYAAEIEKASIELNKILAVKLSSCHQEEEVVPKKVDYTSCDLVDINNFKCSICGNTEDFKFERKYDISDIIYTKCEKCNSTFSLEPSKWYRIRYTNVANNNNEDTKNVEVKFMSVKKGN